VADDRDVRGEPARDGRESPGVTLAPLSIGRAWNVMGPRAPEVAPATLGVDLPRLPNTTAGRDPMALWIGPASWLVVSAAPAARSVESARASMSGAGAALFDVTASRVAFALGGPQAALVLAAGCPLDLHPRAFAAGTCAQSVRDRVNTLVVRVDDGDVAFILLVARSFGRDVWHGLCSAADEWGYAVATERPWPGVAPRV
jgi:sarcosine oxidase subunit gamma